MTAQQLERILIVEDDPSMRAGIRLCLEGAGYRVLEADDGDKGLKLIREEKPALIVLDVMMPKLNGYEVASELRRCGTTTPILMLTTRQEIPERVKGLLAGADDYLAKPFDRRELLARIYALLRRRGQTEGQVRRLIFDSLAVDLVARTATRNEETVALTKTEYAILDLLAKNLGVPVSRDQMLDSVWGYTYFPSTRTVDTHIYRLRKKLGDDGDTPRWIRKVQGQGYLLQCQTE